MGPPRVSVSGVRGAKPPVKKMCRNIRPLFNFDPAATDEEIRAASLQFVRKISGFTKPSRANEAAFDAAVRDVTGVARALMGALRTDAPARDRDEWIAQKRAKAQARYGAMNAARTDQK